MVKQLEQIFSYCIIPMTAIVTLLSVLILSVSLPPLWTPIYQKAMPSEMHTVFKEDAKKISDGFWQNKSYTEINNDLTATKYRFRTLSKKEITHFEDVRKLVHFFFYPASLGFALLFIWRFIIKKPIHWHISLAYLLFIGGSLAIWGTLAWRHMFRTLHWWIFQDDSWILPDKCYTLILFPYSAWQLVSSIVMGTLASLLLLFSLPQLIAFLCGRKQYKQKKELK